MQILAPSSSIRHRPAAVDVTLAVMIGLAATLAKRYLDFHLGVPGHAGVGWIAVLVSGRLLNGRPGVAAVAGTIVHVAKYGFIFADAWISEILRRVEIFGFLGALANHIIFGAAGGMLGWAIWRSGGALRARLQQRLTR